MPYRLALLPQLGKIADRGVREALWDVRADAIVIVFYRRDKGLRHRYIMAESAYKVIFYGKSYIKWPVTGLIRTQWITLIKNLGGIYYGLEWGQGSQHRASPLSGSNAQGVLQCMHALRFKR